MFNRTQEHDSMNATKTTIQLDGFRVHMVVSAALFIQARLMQLESFINAEKSALKDQSQ